MGVLWLNPVLTDPIGEASAPQAALTAESNSKEWVPGVSTLQSRLAINRGFSQPFLRCCDLLEWLTELRETLYLLLAVYHKGYR